LKTVLTEGSVAIFFSFADEDGFKPRVGIFVGKDNQGIVVGAVLGESCIDSGDFTGYICELNSDCP